MIVERFGLSERRACRITGQHRSTQRHRPVEGGGRAARAVFPREQIVEVKRSRASCERRTGCRWGGFSRTELQRLVVARGLSEASASTIWRWLRDDALKPWQQRSWIFIRDPRGRGESTLAQRPRSSDCGSCDGIPWRNASLLANG